MTPRQRLLAVLDGKKPDTLPIWLLFPYHQVDYYVDVRSHPAYKPIHERAIASCITLDRRNVDGGPLFAPEVSWTNSEGKSSDGTHERRSEITYKGRKLQGHTKTFANGNVEVKKLLSSEEDLAFFADLPTAAEAETLSVLDKSLARLRREREEFPDELGGFMLDLGEPMCVPYNLSNLEELAIWSVTCPEVVEKLLDKMMARFRVIYQWALDHKLADVYFSVGSELAAPPMVSRETFRRWVLPYSRELIDMIHKGGAKSIQHFHGQVRTLLEDFVEMGADALHTIEAPPVGNCTLREAFEIVGDKMVLIGNIQYDDMCSRTPEEIGEMVRSVIDEAGDGRFILSPTAGPYDPTPPPRLLENYHAFIDAGAAYGGRRK